jgi:hypothetical protein
VKKSYSPTYEKATKKADPEQTADRGILRNTIEDEPRD